MSVSSFTFAEAQTVEIPDEPPPPYVSDDDRPLLKDEEDSYRHSQQAQRSLEQKLVQAGLLSVSYSPTLCIWT